MKRKAAKREGKTRMRRNEEKDPEVKKVEDEDEVRGG